MQHASTTQTFTATAIICPGSIPHLHLTHSSSSALCTGLCHVSGVLCHLRVSYTPSLPLSVMCRCKRWMFGAMPPVHGTPCPLRSRCNVKQLTPTSQASLWMTGESIKYCATRTGCIHCWQNTPGDSLKCYMACNATTHTTCTTRESAQEVIYHTWSLAVN